MEQKLTILIKTGSKANLANAGVLKGELKYTTDTKELFIGDGTSNVRLSATIIETTYAALKVLRDTGKLTPGQQYRITDYVTTTVQANTQSAGHQFDIIVTADDVDKLNESARACLHEGDTYFANSKLEAWKLKYCLDNDVNRFLWADEVNGKGVIYRMIDEFNNDVPYDFKNIQYQTRPGFTYNQWGQDYTFERDASLDMIIADIQYYGYVTAVNPSGWSSNTCWLRDDPATTSSVIYNASGTALSYGGTILAVTNKNYDVYTFSKSTSEDFDVSLNGSLYSCYDNTIRPYVETQHRVLNRITFVGNFQAPGYPELRCYGNTFGNDCHDNNFSNSCHSNTFGNGCYGNTFYRGCNSNTFGNSCYGNTFGENCYFNTFGENCCFIAFGGGSQYNTFGNSCGYLQISHGALQWSKRYIHVENGTQGASKTNKFDLYDPAMSGKSYQVTFKKDADGRYVMTWLDDYEKLEGKYKDNNIDTVWKALPHTAETIISELVTATEDTGWINLTVTNASIDQSSYNVYIRKIGKVVTITGKFNTTGTMNPYPPTSLVASFPDSTYAPKTGTTSLVGYYTLSGTRTEITFEYSNMDNTLNLIGKPVPSGAWVFIPNITYITNH